MQWPPTPQPGCRMLTRGWRLASEINSHTLISSLSQIMESSLTKAMFTSRKEFSVSLHISAVRALVIMQSPFTKVLYKATACFEHFEVMPPIMRSFSINSRITWPGRTRSGQWAIRISESSPFCWGKLKSGRSAASQADICSVAPTGEVDSKITKSPFFKTGAMALLAASI